MLEKDTKRLKQVQYYSENSNGTRLSTKRVTFYTLTITFTQSLLMYSQQYI